MTFIVPGLFGGYVKKEDAKEYLERAYKVGGFAPFMTALVLVVMEVSVRPRLMGIYSELEMVLPVHVQYASSLSWLFVIVTLAYAIKPFVSQLDLSKVNSFIAKHKNGEMINSRKLVTAAGLHKQEYYALLFIALMVIFIIFTIIMPIYQLTSSL